MLVSFLELPVRSEAGKMRTNFPLLFSLHDTRPLSDNICLPNGGAWYQGLVELG